MLQLMWKYVSYYVYMRSILVTAKRRISITFINCCKVGCETWRFVTVDDIVIEGCRPECDNVN